MSTKHLRRTAWGENESDWQIQEKEWIVVSSSKTVTQAPTDLKCIDRNQFICLGQKKCMLCSFFSVFAYMCLPLENDEQVYKK